MKLRPQIPIFLYFNSKDFEKKATLFGLLDKFTL